MTQEEDMVVGARVGWGKGASLQEEKVESSYLKRQ